jgi:hypothetical protein
MEIPCTRVASVGGNPAPRPQKTVLVTVPMDTTEPVAIQVPRRGTLGDPGVGRGESLIVSSVGIEMGTEDVEDSFVVNIPAGGGGRRTQHTGILRAGEQCRSRRRSGSLCQFTQCVSRSVSLMGN